MDGLPVSQHTDGIGSNSDGLLGSVQGSSSGADTTGGLPLRRQSSGGSQVRPPSPGRDLSADLLEAGWRKFWSKREKRFYYFNKVTNQSLWDLPLIGGSPQNWSSSSSVTSIATPSPSSVMSPPPLDSTDLAAARRKRPSQGAGSFDSSSAKKTFTFTSPAWNLEIPSNAVIYEREMLGDVYPPQPAVEVRRSNMVGKLRNLYQDMCHSRQGIDAPVDSFNRWLLERQVCDKGRDSLLPSDCSSDVSTAMYREIMADVPVKLVTPQFVGEARRQLAKYAEAAQKLIDSSSSVPAESRKQVKWHVDDMLRWQRSAQHNMREPYLERLAHLKRECQPHIINAAKSSIESICRKVYSLGCEDVRKLHEMQSSLWKEQGIEEVSPPSVAPRRKVCCYPVLLSIPSPRLPVPEISSEGDYTNLMCEGQPLQIATTYFHKLEQLYKLNCKDDPYHYNFPGRVWCLLKRYQTYFGVRKTEGQILQVALPIPVFECLNRLFGVTFECFASPLNSYYNQYCSAFPDTDGYFGSRGPVLDFYPKSGSFEVNPPFCEELMEAMVDHFENLLMESEEPLSFIIFLPEWRDPPTEALLRLDSSQFNRHTMKIPAYKHEHRHGFQHVCQKSDLYVKSMHGTEVFFLQNSAGTAMWGPTTIKLAELSRAFIRKHPL